MKLLYKHCSRQPEYQNDPKFWDAYFGELEKDYGIFTPLAAAVWNLGRILHWMLRWHPAAWLCSLFIAFLLGLGIGLMLSGPVFEIHFKDRGDETESEGHAAPLRKVLQPLQGSSVAHGFEQLVAFPSNGFYLHFVGNGATGRLMGHDHGGDVAGIFQQLTQTGSSQGLAGHFAGQGTCLCPEEHFSHTLHAARTAVPIDKSDVVFLGHSKAQEAARLEQAQDVNPATF